LVVSVGVKVAVISDDPTPTTVAVSALRVTTDVFADVYVKVPGVLGEGVVTVKESPYAFEIPDQVKVGACLAILIEVEIELSTR
jgi:hypothetical protein